MSRKETLVTILLSVISLVICKDVSLAKSIFQSSHKLHKVCANNKIIYQDAFEFWCEKYRYPDLEEVPMEFCHSNSSVDNYKLAIKKRSCFPSNKPVCASNRKMYESPLAVRCSNLHISTKLQIVHPNKCQLQMNQIAAEIQVRQKRAANESSTESSKNVEEFSSKKKKKKKMKKEFKKKMAKIVKDANKLLNKTLAEFLENLKKMAKEIDEEEEEEEEELEGSTKERPDLKPPTTKNSFPIRSIPTRPKKPGKGTSRKFKRRTSPEPEGGGGGGEEEEEEEEVTTQSDATRLKRTTRKRTLIRFPPNMHIQAIVIIMRRNLRHRVQGLTNMCSLLQMKVGQLSTSLGTIQNKGSDELERATVRKLNSDISELDDLIYDMETKILKYDNVASKMVYRYGIQTRTLSENDSFHSRFMTTLNGLHSYKNDLERLQYEMDV